MFTYKFKREGKRRVLFQKRPSVLIAILLGMGLFLLFQKEVLSPYLFLFLALSILLTLPFNERTYVNLTNRVIVQSINFFHIELYSKWIIPMNEVVLHIEREEETSEREAEVKAVELHGDKIYSIGRVSCESLLTLEHELFGSAA